MGRPLILRGEMNCRPMWDGLQAVPHSSVMNPVLVGERLVFAVPDDRRELRLLQRGDVALPESGGAGGVVEDADRYDVAAGVHAGLQYDLARGARLRHRLRR